MPSNPEPMSAGPTDAEADAVFAVQGGKILRRGKLWHDARSLIPRLPDKRYVLNLCEDRYLFCVALLAAAARGQICLLPPSGQPHALRDILHDYPDAYLASEREPPVAGGGWFKVEPLEKSGTAPPLAFQNSQLILIAFTSGSTGRPKPCPHCYGSFRISTRLALAGLGLEGKRWLVVSTTPQQHMYGLETSVFWPLFSNLALHAGRPFFPEDIRRVVESSPLPVLLASTPTHLRALAATGGNWDKLAGIISSTADLPPLLARQTEAALTGELWEIYGSTETLSFASRKTARESLWRPYLGATLRLEDGRILLHSPHLKTPAVLQDRFRIEADGRFIVLGRDADLVKIGGKRASLADMNRKLRSIAGIDDGRFFIRDDGRGECRMEAAVVSSLDRRMIRQALRSQLDEGFMPRKIHFVAAIPRNEVGKIAKEEWDNFLSLLEN